MKQSASYSMNIASVLHISNHMKLQNTDFSYSHSSVCSSRFSKLSEGKTEIHHQIMVHLPNRITLYLPGQHPSDPPYWNSAESQIDKETTDNPLWRLSLLSSRYCIVKLIMSPQKFSYTFQTKFYITDPQRKYPAENLLGIKIMLK